jgi:anti-sigma regulatory factor (Ser/Thr protein kinase)
MSDPRIQAKLTVKSDVAILGLLGDWLAVLARAVPGADHLLDLEMHLRLLVTELFTNCLRHAYGGRSDGDVELTFTASGRTMELSVRDFGVGPAATFDVNQISLPPNNEESASGRGLFLVRQLVDRLTFQGGPSGSTFTATLEIPASRPSDEELLLAFFAEHAIPEDDAAS